MTLTVGATLGHYRVDSLLGKGGMGEVYAAHDDRLNRTVALKLIPGNLAVDPTALERFRREAQATAALNHPNIVTVFSIESAGDIHFLTMELVDGQTLESEIRPGGIDARRLFEIGSAIADAAGAAHDKGIVHRDLKPSNIMVTRDRRVKVLDFGLARLRDAYSEEAAAGETATQAPGLTAPHAVIGTAAYMSPEQADGQPTDHRSDIFSIGVILYELACGRRPFGGDSSLAIRSAVAAATPQPLPEVAPGVPRDLWRIVRRALAKDRDRRYQSAKDLRNDLLDAARDLDIGPQAPAPPRPSRGWWAAGFLALIAGSLAGIAALLRDDAPAPRPSVVRFAITEPPAFIPRPGGALRTVAITRDGSMVAYVTNGQVAGTGGGRLVLRPLAGSARMLDAPPGPGALAPFFSPDGSRLGFRSGSFRYYVMSAAGGTPEPVTDSVIAAFTNAAWFGSAGLIYESYGTLFTKTFGGPAEQLARPDESRHETYLYGVSLTPDGRGVLYSLVRDDMKSFDEARVMVKDLATGVAKELITGGMGPSVTTSGHLLFGRGGTLFAATIDVKNWTLTGPAVPVVNDLLTEPHDGYAPYAVSDNGTLVYIQGRPMPYQREVLVFDRRGEPVPSRIPTGAYDTLRMSPSGDALAVSVYGPNIQTWLYDLRRDSIERLTDTWSNEAPEWSRDGTRIAHQSTRGGEPHVYVSGVRDRANETRLASSRAFSPTMSFSADDRYIVLSDGTDVFRLRTDRPSDKETLVATRAAESSPAVSPDGRWLAFLADDTGRFEVYVVPYGRPEPRRQISRDGALPAVRWTKRGAELCYRSGASIECAGIGDDGGAAGAPRRVLTAPAASGSWDVSPDGKRFYLLRSDNEGRLATAPIQVVLNWFEELRAKAPVP